MRRFIVKIAVGLCHIPLLAWLMPAYARPYIAADDGASQAYIQLAQAAKISKSKAAEIAKTKYGGKVLKVTPVGDLYKVKLLLENGRVKVVTISGEGK